MTNTLSKCLVNNTLPAAKLLTNYKEVSVNKTFIPDSFGLTHAIKLTSILKLKARMARPFNTRCLTGAGRWGQTTFISETSDLWIRGRKQQMKSRATSGPPTVAQVNGAEKFWAFGALAAMLLALSMAKILIMMSANCQDENRNVSK